MLALLCLGCCYYRRRRRQRLQALNERPSPLLLPQPEVRYTDIDPAVADPFAALPTNRQSGTAHPLQTWSNSRAGSMPNFAVRDARSSSPIANHSHTGVASSGNLSATSSVRVSIGAGAVAAAPPGRDTPTPTQLTPVRLPTALPGGYPDEKLRRTSGTPTRNLQQDAIAGLDVNGTRPNTVLTDEQADFVNSLFNNNVPAPVVARVLERMLTNPQGANNIGVNDPELHGHVDLGSLRPLPQTQTPTGGASWPTASDLGDGETTVGTAPPSYDYVRAVQSES